MKFVKEMRSPVCRAYVALGVAVLSLLTLGANVSSSEPVYARAGMHEQDTSVWTQVDHASKSPHMMWVVIGTMLFATWWAFRQRSTKRFSWSKIASAIRESLAERKARKEVEVGGN